MLGRLGRVPRPNTKNWGYLCTLSEDCLTCNDQNRENRRLTFAGSAHTV